MKPLAARRRRNASGNALHQCSAHTLPEVLIASAIMVMVMAGIVSSHLLGMRLFEITKAKLGASDDARTTISFMISEIRAAKDIRIGSITGTTNFTEVALETPQTGSAIEIYPSTNHSIVVRYFIDSTDTKLKRVGSNGKPTVIASSITNRMVFSSEDYTGAVLRSNINNRVISLTLQFYQLQYPTVSIGPGQLYDFYQLRTKITPRAFE